MRDTGKRRLRNEIGLMMLTLLSTSCGLVTGVKKCGPEVRNAHIAGEIGLVDGTSTANAGLTISEAREPGRPATEVAALSMYAQSYIGGSGSPSDFLRGHVTGAELRDTQSPSRLLGSYPPYTGTLPPETRLLPPNVFAFDGSYGWQVPIEEGRALLLAGQLILVLQTDLPSQPTVSIPLTVALQNDPTWVRMTGEGCG